MSTPRSCSWTAPTPHRPGRPMSRIFPPSAISWLPRGSGPLRARPDLPAPPMRRPSLGSCCDRFRGGLGRAHQQVELALKLGEERRVEISLRNFVELMGSRVFVNLPFAVSRASARPEQPFALEQQGEKLQQRRVRRVWLRRRVTQRDKKILRGQLERAVGILVRAPRLVAHRPAAKHKARLGIARILALQAVMAPD